MKATFTFDLPEEQEECNVFQKANDMNSVIWQYLQWLREQIKYSQRPEEELKIIQEVRTKFFDLLSENEIDTMY